MLRGTKSPLRLRDVAITYGAGQSVSIDLCCKSNRRGPGGCRAATLQQKCKAAVGKWGKTSWVWVPWGHEQRYLCPLGVPALMQQYCTLPRQPQVSSLPRSPFEALFFPLISFGFFFFLHSGQTLLPTCFLLANESKKEVWGKGVIIWTFLGL